MSESEINENVTEIGKKAHVNSISGQITISWMYVIMVRLIVTYRAIV